MVNDRRIVRHACVLAVALGFVPGTRAGEPPHGPAMPYNVDHTAPLEATESVRSADDRFTQYRVEFNGIQRDRVPGYLYVPKDGTARHPAVLLQYGSGGNKNTDYIVAIGKEFVARRFVVLTIDSPGRGERKGQAKKPTGTGWLFGNEGRELFLQHCGDYSRAVDFLLTRPEVDPDRIGYVGISWGAITGITYAAHDPRVKAVTSIVGGGNFFGQFPLADPKKSESDTPPLRGKPDGTSPAAERPRDPPPPIDPVFHVGRIAPRPLLMINVTKDQLIPRVFAESLHKAAGPSAKVTWMETDHYFSGIDRKALTDSVIDFMERNLASRRTSPERQEPRSGAPVQFNSRSGMKVTRSASEGELHLVHRLRADRRS